MRSSSRVSTGILILLLLIVGFLAGPATGLLDPDRLLGDLLFGLPDFGGLVGVALLRGRLEPARFTLAVLADSPEPEGLSTQLLETAALAVKDLLVLGPQQAGSRHNRRTRPDPDLPADG